MDSRLLILFAYLIFVGCAGVPAEQVIDPAAAIASASNNPDGASVRVRFRVARLGDGKGIEAGRIFLDSDIDYRSPKSLNVVLVGAAAVAAGGNVETARDKYLSKIVEVVGTVKRVTIGTVSRGGIMGQYYYQTQLEVSAPSKIQVISSSDGNKIVKPSAPEFGVEDTPWGMLQVIDRLPATRQVAPQYPPIAKKEGVTGSTVNWVLVDESGTVKDVKTKVSSGDRRLDEAAIYCLKRWKYSPFGRSGPFVLIQNIAFSLSEP